MDAFDTPHAQMGTDSFPHLDEIVDDPRPKWIEDAGCNQHHEDQLLKNFRKIRTTSDFARPKEPDPSGFWPRCHFGIWPPRLFQGSNCCINPWVQRVNHQACLEKWRSTQILYTLRIIDWTSNVETSFDLNILHYFWLDRSSNVKEMSVLVEDSVQMGMFNSVAHKIFDQVATMNFSMQQMRPQ